MNTSVERKIASVAEKLEGVTYLFDNWATANVRLDKMPLPAIINLLPISGKFVISRTQLRDSPNCMIAFADKTKFDFDGVENEEVIERCKGYAVQFIRELNRSELFEWVSDEVPYSVFYDKLDVNVTGIVNRIEIERGSRSAHVLVMEDRRKEVKAILCEELDNLRQRIIENHIRAGQRASGKTIKSLHVVVDDNHGTLYGRQAFGVLEVGRASGKVPKGFYKIIQQWMIDKGIQVERPRSFAYLVARKIATEGTSLYHSGTYEDIYTTDVEQTIRDIMDRVFGILVDDVTHINLHSNENS